MTSVQGVELFRQLFLQCILSIYGSLYVCQLTEADGWGNVIGWECNCVSVLYQKLASHSFLKSKLFRIDESDLTEEQILKAEYQPGLISFLDY